MSPPYINMGVCLTAIPYRNTLRDSQGKVELTIGHLLAIPEELETVIISDKAYEMGILKNLK
ncbi:hypothetical protein H8356DRAFT_1340553 [Neocallimastix lanati (nom. inval.)]|nr:hypothetical protein H8356DRAFT_1340553 [Neocallimastix sp. JGI-2020a]